MKNIILIIVLISLFTVKGSAQLESIFLFTDYSSAQLTRLQVSEADAIGGGVKINFKVAENFSISLNGGYKLYSLNEPDVLNNWNWVFWTQRYYPKIVSDLNADPNLSVDISAVQKMDLIPVSFSFNYNFQIIEKLEVMPAIGAGVYFYTRRMYAVENWSKYFPDADYTFDYSFRNFAPSKKGNPFFVNGNLNLQYRLFSSLSVFSIFQYTYIIPTEGKFGYDSFPLDNEISIALGLAIYY